MRRVEVLRFSALVPENSVKAPPPKFAASRKALSKLCLQIFYFRLESIQLSKPEDMSIEIPVGSHDTAVDDVLTLLLQRPGPGVSPLTPQPAHVDSMTGFAAAFGCLPVSPCASWPPTSANLSPTHLFTCTRTHAPPPHCSSCARILLSPPMARFVVPLL